MSSVQTERGPWCPLVIFSLNSCSFVEVGCGASFLALAPLWCKSYSSDLCLKVLILQVTESTLPIWCSILRLCKIFEKIQFPRLFALELDKEIVVANKMGASSVSASFRRDVRDGAERQQWDDLSSILNSVCPSHLPR
ncbi:hypothetical protein Tco_0800564 [Tanacetum coccineum]|uniref:Uncharacterized protein n=1 Tax=Tanacetum coccineum TaxID=301880 RepID=A0ABQ4ZVW1_9ASTR